MKSLFRLRSGLLRQDRGAEVAEAAVILPVLFLLLFSIYWFGRGFNVYGTINHAAREGARAAAVPACASCGPPCNTSTPVCDAPVVAAVNNALVAAHLDPTQAVPFVPSPALNSCGGSPAGLCQQSSSGTFEICRNVEINPNSAAPAVCGVAISFKYPYQLAVPFSSLGQQILLKAQVQMQDEQ